MSWQDNPTEVSSSVMIFYLQKCATDAKVFIRDENEMTNKFDVVDGLLMVGCNLGHGIT